MTVTVQSALGSVQAAAGRLGEAVAALVLIAVEDQPRGTELHLTTLVHDAALDLGAEAEHANAALRPDPAPADSSVAKASRTVVSCQVHVNLLGAVLVRELATAERLNDLAALGRERGREAGAWAAEIVRCIESCQHYLWTDMQPALLGYWQELADLTDRSCAPSDQR
jgi:hypothetical protein